MAPYQYQIDYGEVFKVVEQMPRYPGCEQLENEEDKKVCSTSLLLDHVYSNIQIPQGLDSDTSGVVSFTVNKIGDIKNVMILRDAGCGTGAEMVRIVETFPRWIPGRQRGRAVRVQWNLSIRFEL